MHDIHHAAKVLAYLDFADDIVFFFEDHLVQSRSYDLLTRNIAWKYLLWFPNAKHHIEDSVIGTEPTTIELLNAMSIRDL